MEPQADITIYSISELTRNIKIILEDSFADIWLEGEVSNLRRPSSGHMYFTLKDEQSQMQAVMFRGANANLKFEVKDGLKVLVYGHVTVYEKGGNYQINVKKIEPKGMGELQLAFLQLKEKLEKEGLFAEEKKKPIPLFPTKIGVVTSPTGAALRDILHVLDRRFANVHIIINPAAVQGHNAKFEITRAIEEFNQRQEVEVIIVGRGGGSIEDLWAFNEEIVARAIYNSRIPVISAVGHEIDWTISDFVADLRVPTPSAAAELVIAKESELKAALEYHAEKIQTYIQNKLDNFSSRIELAKQHYVFKEPKNMVLQYKQRIDEIENTFKNRMAYYLTIQQNNVKHAVSKLEALNPLNILKRGYGISTRLDNNEIIKDAAALKKGEQIKTKVAQGSFVSLIEKILEN